jgi:hypothetical protein
MHIPQAALVAIRPITAATWSGAFSTVCASSLEQKRALGPSCSSDRAAPLRAGSAPSGAPRAATRVGPLYKPVATAVLCTGGLGIAI